MIYESIFASWMEIIKRISDPKKKNRQNGGPYNVSLPHRQGTTAVFILFFYMIPGSKSLVFHACMKKHDFGTHKT